MSKDKIGCSVGLFTIILWTIYGIGYVMCVVKFCQCDFASPYKAEIIYGVALFTGFGGILGWFNFGH